ncbi:glycoside hydrolase family 15 protein [uncultured Microscilla sp.]|uniref:glycoside hydrolase family 15 protein n=1 Tax=uncultured Microscilla sp. TaxID=432653 RepID=UPI0026092854|nr:glycoside hydrolase family 15 protein [uncultured Microscilla sp.]
MDKRHTYNFGLIGNCAYLAHIAKNTNIVWLCFPRFDSSFVFGSLLDSEKGGEFSVLPPQDNFESTQYYIENTNILCTEIATEEGKYRVTDFAPRFYHFDRYYRPLMLVRKIEPLSGSPRVKVKCQPVGDYGNFTPENHRGSNHIEYLGLEKKMRLTTDVSLTFIEDESYFLLNETKYLFLTYGSPMEASIQDTAETFLNNTIQYWRKWVKSTSISDFYQNKVIRSALVLKMHQYEDTGAIIASATSSLPESPQSTRNWDYRYCWMRDTYYTLNAFNNIGHFEELELYFKYITNIALRDDKRLQPLYKINGDAFIEEKILDLTGYQGNNPPVRVGNQAYEHIQNDVYGQILVSLLPIYADNRFVFEERHESKLLIFRLLKKIEETIDEPDAGLWEFRNKAQYHTYTYLFHWAGSAAALRIGKFLKDEKMVNLATQLQKKSAEYIEKAYDKTRGVYTQAIGTPNLDASTLHLITMGYLKSDSERAKSHLLALEQDLKTPEGLFYRYKHQDDFGEPETTFLICAFWYVEALACVGRLDEAINTFEKLSRYGNHLGLLSEDVSAKDGSQWGNFPQTYSHVGLMNAAARISKKLDKPNFLSFEKR